MGKTKIEKYHTFQIQDVATLILFEPKKREFVWIYMYLDTTLRNGQVSIEIAKYVLYYLDGKHHIHWFSKLKSFNSLAKELKWKISKSDIFHGCKYTMTTGLKTDSPLYPLMSHIMIYKIATKKPVLLAYKSKKDETEVLQAIRDSFKSKSI